MNAMKENPCKILFAASEAVPLVKTGGLADVAGTLPPLLHAMGHDVRVVLPHYRSIKETETSRKKRVERMPVEVSGNVLDADIYETRIANGIPCYLVHREEFFDRTHLYGTSEGDYYDNDIRFIYFSKALFSLCEALSFSPDVLHCHDWQTALVPAFLKLGPGKTPFFRKTKSLLTIHNLAYQGVFPSTSFDKTGLPGSFFTPGGMEFWGNANFLKAGITSADRINTVSPTYCREILTEEFGHGLEGVLLERKNDLFGILNGVDYTEWNPSGDPHLPCEYDRGNMQGKRVCKRTLIEEMNLSTEAETAPLFGMITRLTSQKGIDLVLAVSQEMMRNGIHCALLGEGEARYRADCKSLQKRFPGRFSIRFGYDYPLAHRIQAGCDFLLMPSRFEPCGLNQIHAMRYGTVPVVRATGGLKDTVREFDPSSGTGTGFLFNAYDPKELLRAVDRALRVFGDQGKNWNRLRENCMEQCYSWERSAGEYAKLYKDLQEGTG